MTPQELLDLPEGTLMVVNHRYAEDGAFSVGDIVSRWCGSMDDLGSVCFSSTDNNYREYLLSYEVDPLEEPREGECNVEFISEPSQMEIEYTGGSVNYYKAHVSAPTTAEEPYDLEVNDLIEAFNMTFAEGNVVKAVCRIAADRAGRKKKGNNSVYDAEKIVFFGNRILVQGELKAS